MAASIDQRKSVIQKTISIPTSLKDVAQFAAKQKKDVPVVEVKEKVEEEVKGDSSFSEGELENVLNDLIEKYKQEGKSLEITVLKQSWELVKETTVNFTIFGEIQEDVFNKMKPDVVSFLRKQLTNSKIQLTYEIKEEVEGKPKLYTSTDKLNYLLSKHGALLDFKNRFGLETDF